MDTLSLPLCPSSHGITLSFSLISYPLLLPPLLFQQSMFLTLCVCSSLQFVIVTPWGQSPPSVTWGLASACASQMSLGEGVISVRWVWSVGLVGVVSGWGQTCQICQPSLLFSSFRPLSPPPPPYPHLSSSPSSPPLYLPPSSPPSPSPPAPLLPPPPQPEHCCLTAEGCSPCGCDIGGSSSLDCHPTSGRCSCRDGVTGERCDSLAEDHFIFTHLPLNEATQLALGGQYALWVKIHPEVGEEMCALLLYVTE